MRVGLQKISHSRSLHKEIRLQVEQQEVELPSIEGLIFINIPRCGAGLLRALWPQAKPWACVQPVPNLCAPLHPLGPAGARGLTCGALTAMQSLRSHAWMMDCWRWWA